MTNNARNGSEQNVDNAIAAHQSGHLEQAILQYRQILNRQPDNFLIMRLKGIAERDSGNLADALTTLEHAAAEDEGNPETFSELALTQMMAGDLFAATRNFQAALDKRSDFPKALANLGALLQFRGHYPQAAELYQRFLAIYPDDIDIRCNYAKTLVELGQTKQALAVLDDDDAGSRSHPQALAGLGAILLDIGDLEHAEKKLEAAIEANPANETNFVNLATINLLERKFQDACSLLDRARNFNPHHAQATADLVAAKAAAGEPEDAIATAERFLEIHPGERTVLAAYALVLGASGHKDRAAALLDYDGLISHVSLGDSDSARKIARLVRGYNSVASNPVSKSTRGGRQTGEFSPDDGPVAAAIIQEMAKAVSDRITGLIQSDAAEMSLMRWPPRNWTLRVWGTALTEGGFQTPHIHPTGWMSGVYYASLPEYQPMQSGTSNQGWLTFGRPPKKYGALEPLIEFSVEPKVGELTLFPSYFFHSTVPFTGAGERISIAFDVVPALNQLTFANSA